MIAEARPAVVHMLQHSQHMDVISSEQSKQSNMELHFVLVRTGIWQCCNGRHGVELWCEIVSGFLKAHHSWKRNIVYGLFHFHLFTHSVR